MKYIYINPRFNQWFRLSHILFMIGTDRMLLYDCSAENEATAVQQ